MLFLSVMHNYLMWHYTRAFFEMFHVWMNLYWFIFHFFSIPELMRTWLSPWKRIVEKNRKSWNFEAWAGYVIIGFLSRVIGFILRTAVIIAGLVSVIFNTVLGLTVYLFWLAIPIIIVILLGFGITFIVTSV